MNVFYYYYLNCKYNVLFVNYTDRGGDGTEFDTEL